MAIYDDFKRIGKEAGTDKIDLHGYHRFYPFFLNHLRDEEMSMLEIGVLEGSSINLFGEFFPLGRIFGMDIGKEYKTDRGEVFKGDQSNLDDLKSIVNKIGEKVDFIIDDGSHVPHHQLITFIYFFGILLKPGGIYIIEDIETNYWSNGGLYGYKVECGLGHRDSLMESFKYMVDGVNDLFVKDSANYEGCLIPESIRKQISMVTFAYNSIIIRKKDEEDYKYNYDEYWYKDFL
jgi:hypothetical protein